MQSERMQKEEGEEEKNAFHVGRDEAMVVMAVSMETQRKNIGTRCRGARRLGAGRSCAVLQQSGG